MIKLTKSVLTSWVEYNHSWGKSKSQVGMGEEGKFWVGRRTIFTVEKEMRKSRVEWWEKVGHHNGYWRKLTEVSNYPENGAAIPINDFLLINHPKNIWKFSVSTPIVARFPISLSRYILGWSVMEP